MYKRVKDIEGFPSTMKKLLKELKFNGVDLIKKLRYLFSAFNDQVEEIRKDAEDLNISKLDQIENTEEREVYKTNPQDREEFEQVITIDKGEDKSLTDKLSLGITMSVENYTKDSYNKIVSVSGKGIEKNINTDQVSEIKTSGPAFEEIILSDDRYKNVAQISREAKKLLEVDSTSSTEITTIGNLEISDIIEEGNVKRRTRAGGTEKMDLLLEGSQVSIVSSSGKVLHKSEVNAEEVVYTGNPLSGDKDIADKSFTKQYGVVFKQPMLSYLDSNYHKIKDFEAYKRGQDTINSNTSSEVSGIKSRLTQIENRLTALENK